ncbi:hypothetical protein MTO96_009087 [Rhipicephalus appendiculatus]
MQSGRSNPHTSAPAPSATLGKEAARLAALYAEAAQRLPTVLEDTRVRLLSLVRQVADLASHLDKPDTVSEGVDMLRRCRVTRGSAGTLLAKKAAPSDEGIVVNAPSQRIMAGEGEIKTHGNPGARMASPYRRRTDSARPQTNGDEGIKEKTLFTISLAGYIYWVRNGSLTGVTKGRVEKHALSGYWDICRKVDDASWNHKYIRETGCLTAWSGRNYVSSLSPKSFKFLDGKREIKGVVVFDIEKDDFKGMCGDPYPMLRALKQSLAKYKGDK